MKDLRTRVSELTGLPVELVEGKDARDMIARARAILEYRRESLMNDREPVSTREQFAEWMGAPSTDDTTVGAALSALNELEAGLSTAPRVKDSGEVDVGRFGDARPAREQFASWFKQYTAYNPRRSGDGLW